MNKVKVTKLCENIIWLLTTLLFSLFYILETNPFISAILFIITAIIFIISVISNSYKFNIKLDEFHIFILLFSIYCLLSSIWAVEGKFAIEKGITIIQLLVCMSILYSYYSSYDSVDKLLKSVMYGGFIVSVYCILFYGLKEIIFLIASGGQLENTISNPNSIGMVCAISIIISTFYILNKRRIFLIYTIIPNLIIVGLSGSRKALVVLLMGIIFLFLRNFNIKNVLLNFLRYTVIFVFLFYMLKFVLSFEMFENVLDRMEGLFALITKSGVVDSSTLKRQELIINGINQFKETPIFGIGIGNAFHLNNYGYFYLHNNYIELLACGGLIGFCFYYIHYFYICFTLYKFKNMSTKYFSIIIIMIIILLVMDYGYVSYYSKATYFYFMIFYIYIKNLKKLAKSKKKKRGDSVVTKNVEIHQK